jgi:hypothetical protein
MTITLIDASGDSSWTLIYDGEDLVYSDHGDIGEQRRTLQATGRTVRMLEYEGDDGGLDLYHELLSEAAYDPNLSLSAFTAQLAQNSLRFGWN